MSNLEGTSANVLPGVYSTVQTASVGSSVAGGTRIAALIGEGSRSEVIVASARGGGVDGLNSSYTSTNGADGRHFTLSLAPVIESRTTLFRNGIPLQGLEEAIDDGYFNNRYDYRIDPDTGHIEMQASHLVDQGGEFWKAGSNNVGTGSIENLTIVDANAPTETWTIKCISVQRDSLSVPIANTAKFIAFGTVSGTPVDSLGNPIFWIANDVTVSNGILQFSILETSTVFREGDSFTIKVASGVLNKNDSLTATYIALTDLNDPTFFTSMDDIQVKHGPASTDNNLTLGCQLAFANVPPGIMCVQAAPPIPRRTSYELAVDFDATSLNPDEFVLPLPFGVSPDFNSNIHFFVTNPTTGVETQLLPNKLEFYTIDTTGFPTLSSFVFDDDPAPAGYSFFYSVIQDNAALNFGTDGYINANQIITTTAEFSSASLVFDSSYVGMNVKIESADNPDNIGEFEILSVTNGVALIETTGSPFVSETSLKYEINDPSSTSDYVVVNHNVIPNGYSLRVTLVTTKDATFYDVGWLNALEALETAEIDILVALPKQTKSVIFQNALAHCKTMSNIENRKERVLFMGAIQGLTPDNLLGNEDAAVEDLGVLEGIQGDDTNEILAGSTEDLTNYSVVDAFGTTFRCVYFFPDEIVVQAGTENVTIDGFYMACAAAGYLSGTPNIALPLTNKVLAGFTINKKKQYKNIIMEQLAAAGVTVVRPVQGGGNVVWGLTTTQSGFVEEEEISIIFIRDRVAKSMRAGFTGFIGSVLDDTTVLAASARANSMLTGFISQGIITDFKDLKVQIDSVDPTQLNIQVRVAPSYPVNFIFIKISVGLL